jgi:putative PIN family toxin of toxin-antitoxin system
VIRAVLDVNVLISAFIGGADGPPRKLIYAWREGRFTLVVSPALLMELTTVLGRPKFDRWAGNERAALWIASLSAGGDHRDDPDAPPVGIRDPEDEYLVALGRRSDVDVLVSGDGDLLEAELDGLKVVRPAEFLEMLSASEPQA